MAAFAADLTRFTAPPDVTPMPVNGPPPTTPVRPARVLVSLATYNERDNIGPLIAEIHAVLPNADILVIDDNSPDGTGQLVDELAARDSRIHVLHRPGKLGLGTATLAAMNFAMERNYDYLQNMDADFSHPPRYLPGIHAGMATPARASVVGAKSINSARSVRTVPPSIPGPLTISGTRSPSSYRNCFPQAWLMP